MSSKKTQNPKSKKKKPVKLRLVHSNSGSKIFLRQGKLRR